jgi:hypothetical protein
MEKGVIFAGGINMKPCWTHSRTVQMLPENWGNELQVWIKLLARTDSTSKTQLVNSVRWWCLTTFETLFLWTIILNSFWTDDLRVDISSKILRGPLDCLLDEKPTRVLSNEFKNSETFEHFCFWDDFSAVFIDKEWVQIKWSVFYCKWSVKFDQYLMQMISKKIELSVK